MLLTMCDGVTRYEIDAPDHYEVRLNQDGTDFLLVPDPDRPAVPYWLTDHILVEAARCGKFGLKLVTEEPA